jgi:hypothetical protein
MFKRIVIIIIFTAIAYLYLNADSYKEAMLLDGSEPLINYGMDTTGHWWAVTEPFAGDYRIYINGEESEQFKEIRNLSFSPDGTKWAYFARDNVQWFIVENNVKRYLPGNLAGELLYSNNSQELIYSYFNGEEETVSYSGKTMRLYQRAGKLYTDFTGNRIAFKGYRGNKVVMNINGWETPQFDDILPIGFWYDGKFLYAASNGGLWEVYKNDEAITEVFTNITEVAINRFHNVAAIIGQRSSGKSLAVLFSDDYYEPLLGKPYDQAYNLTLHPYAPLLAYNASQFAENMIIYSSTEIFSGQETSMPYFTCDGDDLYFIGCNIDCFINVNGRKYDIGTFLDINIPYVKKSGSNTIAYATSTTMVVRYLDRDELVAGRIIDGIIHPIYNWRTQQYETLGNIYDRLYMMAVGM